MKRSMFTEIKEIDNTISSMPTLVEALSFGDEDEYNDEYGYDNENDGDMGEDGMETDVDTTKTNSDLVSKIRKMALEGMSELAENTDDPNYEILKKIWQFCEKKNEVSVNKPNNKFETNR